MATNTYKTFADALSASATPAAKPTPIAANDNKPKHKPRKETRYRGTLPALKWLYENHPDLAGPVAEAVQALAVSNWDTEVRDDYIEIRPSIGEIIRAASDGESADGTPQWLEPEAGRDPGGNPVIRLGALVFKGGELVEYGRTAKGRKLEPRDRARTRGEEATGTPNYRRYVFGTRATTPSPFHAEPYRRPIRTDIALPPMYDPQRGVEANRAALRAFGIDGTVAFDDLPFPATKCPTVIAKGAEFLGGIAGASGTASSGAVNMGDLPDAPKGEVLRIVEAIASGATLTEIGERIGYKGGYTDRGAKVAIVEAAKVLGAANDNKLKKAA